MKTYIALDLETTGFDATKDQVIEIAAIKFQDQQVLESFHTLINPQTPIPAMVSHITGIREEDLKEAPFFDQIQEKFLNFLGNDPIIGHNIGFDIGFLRSKGLNLQNPLFDTLTLAGILLPGLPSYSLDTLGRLLKIVHEQKHRAMSDTKACHELFLHLLKKISEIDPDIRDILATLLFSSKWQLKELFCSETKKETIVLENLVQNLSATSHPLPVGTSSHNTCQELKECIEKSLVEGKKILIEAAIELDISSSVLQAAHNWSSQSNERGIIALEKSSLQKISELPQTVTLIDAPESYLSLERLKTFMEKKNLADHEISLFIKIMLWLKKTKTGNLKELSLQGKEFSALDEVCCKSYLCQHSEKLCFFQKALSAMKDSKVLLVTQPFFLKDRFSEHPILPEAKYLIMDQADELEKNFTETLALSLTFQSLSRPFEKIKNLLGEESHTPLYASVQKFETRIEILFGLLGIFIEKNSEPFQFCLYLNDTAWLAGNPDWRKVEESAQRTLEDGKEIITTLTGIDKPEIKQALQEAEKTLALLDKILFQTSIEPTLRYINKGQDESIYLKKIPIHSGHMLQKKILGKQKKCVLISKSLTVKHSFRFIRELLELKEDFEEIIITPHHESKKINIFMVEDMPPPATEGSFVASAELIQKIALQKRGKIVVLFGSKKAITATYHAIAPQLKGEGITVLAQYVTGGKGKILEYYKDEAATSVLLVTNSFLEKIELHKGEVDCLIIQKLPFDPPNDPLFVSKKPYYKDLFNDFQVPHAILKFKHQIGKIAHTAEIRGDIVILDSRIKEKSYGKEFLESLPKNINQKYVKRAHILENWG